MTARASTSKTVVSDPVDGGGGGKATGGRAPSRRRRRPPLVPAVLAVLVAAVVAAGLGTAVLRGRSGGGAPAASPSSGQSRTLLDAATHVDTGVAVAVGAGGLTNSLKAIVGADPLTDSKGRPEVFFVAAEPCGACAAQRWSLLLALGRFGSFANVYLGESSATDAHPNLATFSLRAARYSSEYVTLVAAETADSNGKALVTLGSEGQALLKQYDAPPYVDASDAGALPWLDIANAYAIGGSGYPPDVLRGLSWAQIAEQLGDAQNPVTRAIVGNANWITAGVCKVTRMKPANVCTVAPVEGLVRQLPQ